jgi:hypothetical protein
MIETKPENTPHQGPPAPWEPERFPMENCEQTAFKKLVLTFSW